MNTIMRVFLLIIQMLYIKNILQVVLNKEIFLHKITIRFETVSTEIENTYTDINLTLNKGTRRIKINNHKI